MAALRIFLVAATIALWIYLVRAVALTGPAESLIFISDFHGHPWRAMFNADLTAHMIVSALWMVYRERTPAGAAICVLGVALLGGTFTIPYILVTTFRERGDIRRVLLGKHAGDRAGGDARSAG